MSHNLVKFRVMLLPESIRFRLQRSPKIEKLEIKGQFLDIISSMYALKKVSLISKNHCTKYLINHQYNLQMT